MKLSYLLLLFISVHKSRQESDPHPLDPLTAKEISKTKKIILQKQTNEEYLFNIVVLKDPPKKSLLPYFLSGSPIPRNAFVRKSHSVLVSKGTNNIYEAVVNLQTGILESWIKQNDDYKLLCTLDDNAGAEILVKNDSRVIARCAGKGFTDMNLVAVDSWPLGYIKDRKEYKHLKRPYEIFIYGLNSIGDNHYVHPMDFVIVIDIATNTVVTIEDLPSHSGNDKGSNKAGNSIPRTESNYDYKLRSQNFLRKDDKPIKITSPEGPSYDVKGNVVQWQKFKMHIGFNAIEGLYLNMISYNDNSTVRPLLYRASLAEMGIFYGDPRPPFHRKHGFDEGEFGLGYRANSQKSQEDCLGATHFISGFINSNSGDPIEKQNVICITEEDAGILWKHVNPQTKESFVVRSHRLSIVMTATLGNYDYSMKWQFYQDGSIQFLVQLTGILSTNMLAVDSLPGDFGVRVFPQINAQFHQHTFALRLDTEIDGTKNAVYKSEGVSAGKTGSKKNPYGNGFKRRKTYLKTQTEGRSKISPSTGLVWIVTNEDKIHPYTKTPVGFKLVPTNDPKMMLEKDSKIHPQFSFCDYDIWVTKYQEGQIFPGGNYLNNTGIPESVAAHPNESIYKEDIVLWHMFQPIHFPRAEDFPVMPSEERSVWLKPYNFFLENPAMDVPPTHARKTEL